MRSILPLLLLATPLPAAVIYSGQQNLSVAWNDLEGVYVNIATGATATTWPADFDDAPWINLTLGGHGIFNSELVKPVAASGGVSYNPELVSDYYLNLAAGAMLDSSTAFMANAFASQYHVGTPGDPGKFAPATSGFLGFEFQQEAGGDVYYGWLRFTLDSGSFGTLEDWAYDDTPGVGIEVGVIPEPSSAMMAFATGGLAMLRRRRPARNVT